MLAMEPMASTASRVAPMGGTAPDNGPPTERPSGLARPGNCGASGAVASTATASAQTPIVTRHHPSHFPGRDTPSGNTCGSSTRQMVRTGSHAQPVTQPVHGNHEAAGSATRPYSVAARLAQ